MTHYPWRTILKRELFPNILSHKLKHSCYYAQNEEQKRTLENDYRSYEPFYIQSDSIFKLFSYDH